jgi:hypothetical protein
MTQFENGEQLITAKEGFEALRIFLKEFWKRGDGVGFSNDVSWLLSAIEPISTGMPLDVAQWSDWMAAVDKVKIRQ